MIYYRILNITPCFQNLQLELVCSLMAFSSFSIWQGYGSYQKHFFFKICVIQTSLVVQ